MWRGVALAIPRPGPQWEYTSAHEESPVYLPDPSSRNFVSSSESSPLRTEAPRARRPRPDPGSLQRRPRPPPLRPRRAWAPRCLPRSVLQAAVACRRPRPAPAFIPGSAPRRLPMSAPCLDASPPPRLPAAPLQPPVLPPLIPLPLTLSLHPSVTLKSQLQNYSLTAAETREGKAAAGSSSMEQQPSSSRKGKKKDTRKR